jgi:hypothetical protein
MMELTVEKKTDGQTYNRTKSDQDSVRYQQKTEPDFVGSGYHPPKRFVPLLAKFSHPMNATQRIQLFNQLQRHYGNQYVQKVVAAYRSGNVEEDESKLASEIIAKKGSGRALEPANPAVQRLFKSGVIQAKLKIGQPNDIYEQEADRVAEQVMSMPEPWVQRQTEEEEKKKEEEESIQIKPISEQITPLVQRQVDAEEEEEIVQTKEVSGQTPKATPELESRIQSFRGGGQSLPESARAFFEPRFGHDFSQVRVHTSAQAAKTAQAVNARAFTLGHKVVFATGGYAPGTVAGKRLLAHELTHVVQQTGNEAGERNKSLPLNQVPFSQHTLQRVIAIGRADLDAAGITSAQNEIVTTHLVDIVNNTRGDLLFTRDYRRNLIRDTVRDMHQVTNRFNYGSVEELARDVRQRVLASLYMQLSQGRTRRHMGFSYPDKASDGTAGVDPQVNQAALSYWGPVQDPHGDYYFELSRAGRANAYQAIVTLFTEQTNPHLRTLIHCDYLLSVLLYRAWAESIGVSRYNRGVESGLIDEPVLKWNGFVDLQLGNVVPTSEPPFFRLDTPLQQVTVASEGDLIIGDHVVFYNHESYDALIEGVGGIWRLENAIVIDRRGGENRYQGHGYFSPVPKRRLLTGMIRQYDRHISAARRLTRAVERATALARAAALAALHADYPKVHEKVGGGWEISGTGFCGIPVTRDLRPLTMAEAPGLTHPCTGTISVRRPVHTAP